MRSSSPLGALALGLALVGCAQLAQLAGPEREEELAVGVREALRVGAERAVSRTSRPGGFLENPVARIGLPRELQSIAAALRAAGLRGTVDEIEVSMNRAAEQACGEGADLLFDAVRTLSIRDAYGIVHGGDDAATRYLRTSTEDALRERFAPIVGAAMGRLGLVRAYDELIERSRLVSVSGVPTLSLEEYVTEQTVEGLFGALGEEERRIRDEPAARTTEVLRDVFGGV